MNDDPGNVVRPDSLGAVAPSQRGRVAERAYRRYEERGRADGHDLQDWLEAEREVESSDAD